MMTLLVLPLEVISSKPGCSYCLFLSLPVILYHLPHFPPLRKAFEGVNFQKTLLDRLQDIAFAIMLFLIVLNSGSSTEFIYFQF